MIGDVPVTLSKLESRFCSCYAVPISCGHRRIVQSAPAVCRLPLAGTAVDRRARQLPLPPLPSRLGNDRRREREAYARGDEFRRHSYGDVFENPRLMIDELRRLLRPARAALP